MAREAPKPPKVTASVNQAPVAGDDGPYSTTYNTDLTIEASTLLGNDVGKNNDVLSIVEITSATGGTALLINGGAQVVFNPDDTFSGAGSFTYRVASDKGASDTADVAVTVGAPAQAPPVLRITGFTMEEGSSAVFVLRLSEATTVDVTGQFEAREMTATYGVDWTGERTGTFTIKAGDTETSSPTYTALNDSVPFDEAESFIFVLSNVVGATWGDARPALGHIREQFDQEPMMGSDWLI